MSVRVTALRAAGLSHSETRGSKAICASPRLIAAYRVLHRLREPRHPPCALSYFHRQRGTTRAPRAHTFSRTQLSGCWKNIRQFSTTVLLVQHVKDRYGTKPASKARLPLGGEYRARTDDLLHAMQAL